MKTFPSLKLLLICCSAVTLNATAYAANGPSPGKSAAMPTTVVTPSNQHLFQSARVRLFEISQRSDADYADRVEKLQAELLRSLRSRPKKITQAAPAPCENCLVERSLIDCENCDDELAVNDCENCDRDVSNFAVIRPVPESDLLACESCGRSSPAITEPAPVPLFAKPTAPTDGALTFDEPPIDDAPAVTEVAAAEPADEVPAPKPDIMNSSDEEPAQPISFEDAKAFTKDALDRFASAMKLFGLWPDARPVREEFRREIVALEEQVASLQARIENLKRLTNAK